jgi:hypothetical protein
MNMRTILTRLIVGVAITTLAALGADNTIGTWKLNVEQSKFNPGALPIKSLTVLREASDGGVKVTVTGEAPDGTAINASYTAKYDGHEVQVTGNGPYDTIAIKQVNASTLTDQRKKVGTPYRATGVTVVSSDGKMMTLTTKGIGADGKPFTGTLVFEKQ